MCGIAGIFYRNGQRSGDIIPAMTGAMVHRGPDASDFYTDEFVSLGHRRLSIIDLSDAANQPFKDPSGRYFMVFNGEIYNFQEMRPKLRNWDFKTRSDTEVLLAAFVEWGPDFIKSCKGMFAIAIWDTYEQTMYLYRDRLGVKPLYFVLDEAYLVFASEIRSILASGLVSGKLNREMLPDYLTYQSFTFPGSPIVKIEQLEAGTYIEIGRNGIKHHCYWSIGKSRTMLDGSSREDIQKKIKEFLLRSVEQRLISDVPLGAFLSGGIDSSAIVALISEITDKRISTFNVSFDEKEYDESYYAEIVASKFSTDHHRIKVSPSDFLSNLIPALDSMDSPSADGINTYVVSKVIRQAGITVALSGIGGDELFAGYPMFRQYEKLRKIDSLGVPVQLRKIFSALLDRISSSHRIRKASSLLGADNLEITSLYTDLRRILPEKRVHDLLLATWDGNTVHEKWLHAKRELLRNLPLLSQVSAAEYLGYTQHTLLKDTDQMSMAVSLEVREPFFDHELIDYVMCVPDRFKSPRYPKSLLVESLQPLLPREIVFRKKQGFVFPWHIWMKNELFSFCNQRIHNLCDRDSINPDHVRKLWKDFNSAGSDIRWTEVWTLVVLEHWLERNNIN